MAIRTFSWPGVSINSAGLATEANQLLMIQELEDINAELDSQTTGLAQELTLQSAVTELQAVNSELDAQTLILTDIETNTAALASDLAAVEQNTLDTVTELQTLNAVDYATETTLQAANTNLADIELKVLTDSQLRASPVPVSGPLTDVELRATAVPVSGPLTDTELRATPIDVLGPLTDVELRATPVPVSGTVAVSNPGLTDTELRASAVPVSMASAPLPTGAATESTLNDVKTNTFAVAGTVNANGVGAVTDLIIVGGVSGGNAYQMAVSATGEVSVESNQLPAALGSTTSANSLPVVVASDQVLNSKQSGKAIANSPVRNDYSSVNVTTAAYVQLVASLTSATTEIEIFDSSGQTLVLAVGAAASEVDQIFVFPGGQGRTPLAIAAGSRVSIKAVSATASVGEISINFYS